MLSHTGEKPFICKQCNYLFVYLHIRHPGTSFLRSSYNYIFKNIAYVIVYVWPSRTWDEILLPFQKGLFFPLGDIRLFLPTRIRICAYAHHPTWIRHGRIRMAIPSWNSVRIDGPPRKPCLALSKADVKTELFLAHYSFNSSCGRNLRARKDGANSRVTTRHRRIDRKIRGKFAGRMHSCKFIYLTHSNPCNWAGDATK